MSSFRPVEAGADLLPAPAALPALPDTEQVDTEQVETEQLDDELVDLLCDDEAWLDETFREIVATSWDEPPRGGTPRSAARPRRASAPAARAPRHDGIRRSQWCPQPYGRQRSPPAA